MNKSIKYHLNQINNLIAKANKYGKRSIIYEADAPSVGEPSAIILTRILNERGDVEAKVVDIQEGLVQVEW